MASKEKLVERGKRLYQRFVDNVGKNNYEKKLEENPEEYDIGYNSPKKIKQLMKQAEENKANVYKGYTIPRQNKKKQAQKLANKYHNMKNKYNKVDKEGRYYKEELADENVPEFLKQIKVPKKDRQAIYYMKKNLYPSLYGRYQSKYGNLKYLKDYIFGFSLLPEGYNLYKPMTQEWKDLMREHFYNIYFSVGEYIASIKDFKNREKERTGKTLNDTDWSLRTNLEWRKYLYGEGKSSKLHQDLEYTSKYRDNPEIMNIYKAGKHEGIAEAIRMLQNAGIFSGDDSYISHD